MSGSATLIKGSRLEQIRSVEVPPEQAARALRALVEARVGGRYAFGLDPNSPVETFLAEAQRHRVFQILG